MTNKREELIHKIAINTYDTICEQVVQEYKCVNAIIGDPTEEHWDEIAIIVTWVVTKLDRVNRGYRN
jgi:hypothetical protein